MPLRADTNLYPGVNAHLNSHLQNEPGGWADFHSKHVTHLAEVLDEVLPAGYFTRSERGLQIREGVEDPVGRLERTVTDVLVMGQPAIAAAAPAPEIATPPTTTVPLPATFTDEDYLMSVVIYEGDQPVTRLEVLSPANKPPGAHHEQYVEKRQQTLQAGLNMVEIDYLHQQRPAQPRIPGYPDNDTGAFPYLIVVGVPHPSVEEGPAHLYGWGVDDPMPRIAIPLRGDDAAVLDFGFVYNRTVASARYYRMIVDYTIDPPHFDRYHPVDRDRIRERLTRIRAADTDASSN